MSSSTLESEDLPWESQISEFLVCPPPGAVDVQKSAKLRIDLTNEDDGDDATCCGALRGLVETVKHIAKLLPTYYGLSQQDRRQRPGSFWLSFASVTFVIGLCAVLVTLVAGLPVVFLELSEVENGHVDITLSAGATAASAPSLNYTLVTQQIDHLVSTGVLAGVYGLAFPSIAWTGAAYSLAQCGGVASARALWYLPANLAAKVLDDPEAAATCRMGCFRSHCGTHAGPRAKVMALNPAEVAGRLFIDGGDADAVLARLSANGGLVAETAPAGRVVGLAVLNTNIAAELNVKVGDHIVVAANIGDTLRAMAPPTALAIDDWSNDRTLVELRVVGLVSSSLAETFMGTDEWLVVHYDAVPKLIAAGLSPVIPSAQAERVARGDADSAAQRVHFTMPPETRADAYFRSGYKAIRAEVAAWASPLVTALGASQLGVAAPVLNFMSTLDFFSMFLSLVMGVLVMVFAVLSTLLNYSLLTVGLERRRYEIGVQRMIGFTRTDVVCLVFSQSYLYTLPAWLFGLVGGQLFYFVLRLVMQGLADVELSLWLTWRAIGFSTLLAVFIPLAASVFPIRSLLMNRLSDALDTTRGAELSGVRYQIKTPAREQTKHTYTVGGLGLVFSVLGIAIYYLLPLSLMRMDLSTLFTIFFSVLMGMVGGLVLLTSNAEVIVQFAVIQVLLRWWESHSVVQCTLKNLTAHRLRNRRTTLLYTLSVAVAIFLTVMLNINFDMFQFIAYRNVGSCLTATFRLASTELAQPDTLITSVTSEATLLRHMRDSAVRITWVDTHGGGSRTQTFVEYALDGPEEAAAPAFLRDYSAVEELLQPLIEDGTILGVTYRMRPLHSSFPTVMLGHGVSTYGRYGGTTMGIHLVAPNEFAVLDSRFVILRTASDDVFRFGLGESLYTDDASRKVAIGTSLFKELGLQNMEDGFLTSSDFNTSVTNDLIVDAWSAKRYSIVTTTAVMDSCPVYFMTRFPNSLGDILASIPTGLSLASNPFLSAELLPLHKIHIRLANNDDVSVVKQRVRSFLDARNIYTSWADPDSAVKDIKVAFLFLSALLIFAQVMIYIVCFFSLMSSMTTNVLSSSKEIGILLALGMQHKAVYRTFLWEALTLILSSGLLGASIGLVMAYTIQIQNSLMNQITMPFTFATRELLMLIVVGIVSALLASYSPVRFLLSLPSTASIFSFN